MPGSVLCVAMNGGAPSELGVAGYMRIMRR